MKQQIPISDFLKVLQEIDQKLGTTIINGSKAPMVNYHNETFSGVLGVMTKLMLMCKDENSPFIGYDDEIKEGLVNWQTWQLITKNWNQIVEHLPVWLENLSRDEK